MLYRAEPFFHLRQKFLFCPSLKYLRDETAIGRQYPAGEQKSGLDNSYDSQMVSRRVAGEGRGHVAEHQTRPTWELGF